MQKLLKTLSSLSVDRIQVSFIFGSKMVCTWRICLQMKLFSMILQKKKLLWNTIKNIRSFLVKICCFPVDWDVFGMSVQKSPAWLTGRTNKFDAHSLSLNWVFDRLSSVKSKDPYLLTVQSLSTRSISHFIICTFFLCFSRENDDFV